MEEQTNPQEPPVLDPSQTTQNLIKCSCCGAKLTFAPGTMSLKCEFCGTMNEIKIDEQKRKEAIQELDLLKALDNDDTNDEPMEEIHTVKCNCCGASTTFDSNVVSAKCDFCGSPLTITQGNTVKQIKPKALLPFAIEQQKAQDLYKEWLNGLWFAPGDLKTSAILDSGLSGMYMPYWTYDAETETYYTGQRGDHYYETEEYEEDGETKTRQVQHTRWRRVSGQVHDSFDDVLIAASTSLPSKFLDGLSTWKLDDLVPFDEKFLSGFKTETYSVSIKNGFTKAKEVMKDKIEDTVEDDIGGDEQKIDNLDIRYSDLTYKHILLPIWICAFRFGDKSYRFVINGQTGEIEGERPYSGTKITLFIAGIIAAIVLLVKLFS